MAIAFITLRSFCICSRRYKFSVVPVAFQPDQISLGVHMVPSLVILLFAGVAVEQMAPVSGAFIAVNGGDQVAAVSNRAKKWLSEHQGRPSLSALQSLQKTDPDSYALVQNLLSSPSIVLSIENSEHNALDHPQHEILQKAAPAQVGRSSFSGIQGGNTQRSSGLAQNPAMRNIVEAAAGLAEDRSKLQWDFGAAAAPITGPKLAGLLAARTKVKKAVVDPAKAWAERISRSFDDDDDKKVQKPVTQLTQKREAPQRNMTTLD